MDKRGLVTLLFISFVAIAVVSSTVLVNIGSFSSKGVVTVTIQGDSRVYSSKEASIPVVWGTVNVGENIKTVTIANQANTNLKPHLTYASPKLPSGWTMTFSLDNQPIRSGQSATGTLTLKVPADAAAGNYNWNANIALNSLTK